MVNNSKNSNDRDQVLCDQDGTHDLNLCLQLDQYQEHYIETPVYMDLDVITTGEIRRPLRS